MSIDWQRLALAETHKLRIQLLELIDGSDVPLSPKQLAGLTDEPLGNVSYHCNALSDAGLIDLHHTEPVRGALAHLLRDCGQLMAGSVGTILTLPNVESGDETYSLPGRCGNCGWVGTVVILRGYEAPRGDLGRRPYSRPARCNRCGCQTVTTEARA